MSSMPISSHCFCPCESSPATRCALSWRRTLLSMSAMRSRSADVSRTNSVLRTRLSAFIASSRFSNTVWCSKIVGFWNLRPMPACAISASVSRVRSIVWPKNALPASGRVLPVMTSIIVVLPAPLGPMTQRSSPTSIAKRKRVQRLEAVEAHADRVEIQDDAVRSIEIGRDGMADRRVPGSLS